MLEWGKKKNEDSSEGMFEGGKWEKGNNKRWLLELQNERNRINRKNKLAGKELKGECRVVTMHILKVYQKQRVKKLKIGVISVAYLN